MDTRQTAFYKLFNAKAATGFSETINVSDFLHVTLMIATAGGTVGSTTKVRGTVADKFVLMPDLTASASVTAPWDYIGLNPTNAGVFVAGSTGHVSSAAEVKMYELNVNNIDFINLETTITNGTVTAWVRCSSAA